MNPPLDRACREQLDDFAGRALRRQLRTIDSPQQPLVACDGRSLVNFSSNDYLGLANHPALAEAAATAAAKYGFGSGASRLVCGTLRPHRDLEERLASFKQTAAALTFSSGFAAALGTVPALVGPGDVVILDKLAHACLVDAARLSGATLRVFPHNDLGRLESLLAWAAAKHPEGKHLVLTESVFSMDGDRAPLRELVSLKTRFGAWLLLDEAHAFGILGKAGRGLADEEGVAAEIDIQMGTLSKAAGCSGGYIAGSRPLIDLLVNRARSFIYSTAPPAPLAAAAERALQIFDSPEGDDRRARLWDRVRLLAGALPGHDGDPSAPQSAIVPWILGAEQAALDAAQRLREAGFLVPAIRYPTVAKGKARLRFTVTSEHAPEQITALAAAL